MLTAQKNAINEYSKFVHSSRHIEIKPIFDTYVPFEFFKEVLEKKENEKRRKLEEERKKKEEEKAKNSEQKLTDSHLRKKSEKSKKEEIIEEDKKKEEFIKRENEKIFNINLITDEEKEIFKNGRDFEKIKENILNIIQKGYQGDEPKKNLQEQFNYNLCCFSFKNISKIKCPKIKFEENKILFDLSQENISDDDDNEINTNKKSYDNMDLLDEINSYEDESQKINIINDNKLRFKFKTRNGKKKKFLSYNPEFIKNEKEKNPNLNLVIKCLNKYSLDNKIKPFSNKIIIPSENEKQELFIFDPIFCDLKSGNLESIIFEEQLRKRAKFIYPMRQEFLKSVFEKIIQFLFIIKYKIEERKKKKLTNQNFLENIKHGKTKLKEIEGTNIITFSNVSSFMKSQFGNYNIKKFLNKFNENKMKNEEKKKIKRLEDLKKKMKETLNQREEKEFESDEDNIDKKQISRRKDIIPNEMIMETKILQGSNYKPKKKMNYLNGLKMLIQESSKKK